MLIFRRTVGSTDLNQTDANLHDWIPDIDDIKIEFHPKSGRPTKFYRFDDYVAQEGQSTGEKAADPEPWKPFRTRLDFEIAELMLDSHLNAGQSAILLSLIRKAIAQPADFTLSSTDELEKFWTAARETRGTGVRTAPIIQIL